MKDTASSLVNRTTIWNQKLPALQRWLIRNGFLYRSTKRNIVSELLTVSISCTSKIFCAIPLFWMIELIDVRFARKTPLTLSLFSYMHANQPPAKWTLLCLREKIDATMKIQHKAWSLQQCLLRFETVKKKTCSRQINCWKVISMNFPNFSRILNSWSNLKKYKG